jgi:deoxyribodipyrimidine photolyase-related protein
MPNRLVLILGDSLFQDHKTLELDSDCLLFMAEDWELCTHFKYHKQKLVFFLSAMRHHAHQLKKDYNLIYQPLSHTADGKSYFDYLNILLSKHPEIEKLETYVVEDAFFETALINWAEKKGLEIIFKTSPKFLFSEDDFKEYLSKTKKPLLYQYYQQKRKKLKLLLSEEDKPLGGQWSLDADNRKKLPKNSSIPSPVPFEADAIDLAVFAEVELKFTEHPGKLNNFQWQTTRAGALSVLDHFIEQKLNNFGPYEDAFEADQVFLFHSTLSPYLNIGLLQPQEVLDAVMANFSVEKSHLPSYEGFIRQLIGWREFVRGMYRNYNFKGNHFGLNRKMKDAWYLGSTGIPPIDDAIKKVQNFAYNHHIERLMVLGNAMLLCGLHPDEVNKWFMEMYIDSADWVMEPNVYGMSQYAVGDLFATKPYIAGSNYMRKMSHYPKGDWCDIMDGLYWRFIDEHRTTFANNPRMAFMLKNLDKMDLEKRERIFKAADDWQETVSYLA